MAGERELTPMMRQYHEIKEEHPDEVLFFRLGDFYEMFGEDAIEVSRLLNLTLTRRGDAPMCGIPFHAASSYLKRLLDAGRKVAICEQLSLPTNSKELARREVIQVYTPGTVVDDEYLDSFSDNYILSLDIVKGEVLVSCLDLSSAVFNARRLGHDASYQALSSLLARISVSEILVCDDLYFTDRALREVLDQSGSIVTKLPSWSFSIKEGRRQLSILFGSASLSSFGLCEKDALLSPIGALLSYARQMSHSDLAQITNLTIVDDSGRLLMDDSTVRNLEIVSNLQAGGSAYTLLSALDRTCTAAGRRRLKEVLLQPLCDKARIDQRLEWTARLVEDIDERRRVRGLLSSSADLVRLSSKFEMGRSVVRDLIAVRQSLESFFSLIIAHEDYLDLMEDARLQDPDGLVSLSSTIARAVNPECTNARDEGGIILAGYDEELDELRRIHADGSKLLSDYLEKVKAETGIANLKCGENRIIGVFLEVSKGQLDKVPDYFSRRQTLVGGERFTTPELSALEEKAKSAQADAAARERDLYNAIVGEARSHASDLMAIGRLLGRLDVVQCFAEVSALYGYTRPEILDGGELVIEDGRHPVVEQFLEKGEFMSNGFDSHASRFALITGPNMAGKSTYLRQNALIILMAHAGCFVPASRAVIPLCDRIFCRVGASDNLARGESTFLVEMQEAAFILRGATRSSFVIMDEIGRGTSTQDGMSLAYAIMEALLERGCVTLFATHYHELTMMDTSAMQLLTLSVRQEKNDIVFLRKVVQGVSQSSYGLHVARMAGVPTSVIRQAAAFQKRHFADYSLETKDSQLDLFVDTSSAKEGRLDAIVDAITDFDVSASTPLDALNLVCRLQKELSALGGED